jgi:hypothetical protein
MFDLNAIARDVTSALAPFLPFLLKLGDKATEEAAKKVGAAAWDEAKAIWHRIHPSIETSSAATEAAADVVAAPGDTDVEAAFRVQVKKLLHADPQLAGDIQKLTQLNVSPQNRSISVGGSATGVFITGDGNTVGAKND